MHRAEESERGTWLGVSCSGRLAVLTNYLHPAGHLRLGAKTRGERSYTSNKIITNQAG